MDLSRDNNENPKTGKFPSLLKRIRLSDLATDAFLAGNVLDASLTYIALKDGSKVTEFNSILYTVINEIGLGPTMFLKVVLCIITIWILRKIHKEHLLMPLALVFILIALVNLLVVRSQGISI